jgi:hypothetical protein
VEKPCFLFLESSAGAVAAPVVTTAALPDDPAALPGTSAVRAVAPADRSAAGISAPATGARSLATSVTLGDEGGRLHLSGELPPLLSSSSSSSDDDEFSGVARGKSPWCSCSRYSSSRCSPRSRHRILLSFLCAARSCPVATRRGRQLGLGVWVGQTARHPRLPSANDIRQVHASTSRGAERKGKPTYRWGIGKHDERPKVVAVRRHGPKINRAPRPCRCVLLGKHSCISREHANAVGSASSVISKMRSSLSMRGTINGGVGWRGPRPPVDGEFPST